MSLRTELLSAVTTLRRSPGFATVAILTLGLGVGANVALFSVFHSVVLAPLPYLESDRLVGFNSVNAAKALTQPALSPADFRDVHESAEAFSSLGAHRLDFATYHPDSGEPVQLVCAHVTEELFRTLSIAPWRGRVFEPEEFTVAAPRTAVLSHRAWRRHFGARTDVIGEVVRIENTPTTIIGIMPPTFQEPERTDLWLPFPAESAEYFARDSRYWTTIGRLAPGVSIRQAQAELTAIAARLAEEYPAINRGWTFHLEPLLEQRVGAYRPSLALLLGAVGLLLLVACVNLAILMLARGVARLPQFAIRLAVGATPAALARGVLWESLLISGLGAAVGVVLAHGAVRWFAAQVSPELLPRSSTLSVHLPALGYAVLLGVMTGIGSGLLPAWQAHRARIQELLNSGARGSTGRFARRAQAALVVAQMAVTAVVLVGAGLLSRSLSRLQQTPAGIDARGVLTIRIAPGQAQWEDPVGLAAYYDRLVASVSGLPGVVAAAFDCSAPLGGITLRYPFWVEGRPRTEGNADEAVFHSVTPAFIPALRMQMRAGRFITAADDRRAPLVCVINETLARRIFPGENPIGKRIQTVPWLARGHREVVGVISDAKQDTLAERGSPQIYVPSAQSPWFFGTLLVRTSSGVRPETIQRALRTADPTLAAPVEQLETQIHSTTAGPRLRARVFLVFGCATLLLSSFGLYASTVFSVRQRRREIGVRLALGATPRAILQWVLSDAGRLAGLGMLAGGLGALGFAPVLRGLLFDVSVADPRVYAGVFGLLPLVALLAGLHGAITAARVDPLSALQQE